MSPTLTVVAVFRFVRVYKVVLTPNHPLLTSVYPLSKDPNFQPEMYAEGQSKITLIERRDVKLDIV